MAMENPRALVKIKESGDSRRFYLRFLSGVPEPPRAVSRARESWLIWRTWRTIQSSDLDRPIRGSRLFIGRKATIILTRSVLYSDNRIIGQQFSSKELYEFFMGECIAFYILIFE